MVNTKSNENQTELIKNESKLNASQLKRSLAGGLIGATAGYLATPENGKKLKESFSGDKLKSTGAGIGQASKKAVESIKQSPSKLFNKVNSDSQKKGSNEQEVPAEKETSLATGIKNNPKNKKKKSNEENSNFHDRLDRLEEMLEKLIQAKYGESQVNYKKEQSNDDSGKPEKQFSSSDELKNEQEGLLNQEGSKESQSKTKGQDDGKESQSYLQGPLNSEAESSKT